MALISPHRRHGGAQIWKSFLLLLLKPQCIPIVFSSIGNDWRLCASVRFGANFLPPFFPQQPIFDKSFNLMLSLHGFSVAISLASNGWFSRSLLATSSDGIQIYGRFFFCFSGFRPPQSTHIQASRCMLTRENAQLQLRSLGFVTVSSCNITPAELWMSPGQSPTPQR